MKLAMDQHYSNLILAVFLIAAKPLFLIIFNFNVTFNKVFVSKGYKTNTKTTLKQ
jgi:hypothetical protein